MFRIFDVGSADRGPAALPHSRVADNAPNGLCVLSHGPPNGYQETIEIVGFEISGGSGSGRPRRTVARHPRRPRRRTPAGHRSHGETLSRTGKQGRSYGDSRRYTPNICSSGQEGDSKR